MPDSVRAPLQCHIDVEVTRGPAVESAHRVHAAVVDSSGALVATARDGRRVAHWRSCAKPLQVYGLVASGEFDRLGWTQSALALACASHGGEPEHVAIAQTMLSSLGLDESALACGAHKPLSDRGARLLKASGAQATKLHNNCSGKHSAMLARARSVGAPTDGYHHIDHPVQQENWRRVAEWSGTPAEDIAVGVDGCGVPVFALPLSGMALAYARLITAGDASADRIVKAMVDHPFLVGGTDRFDTVLMQVTNGAILAKLGAEGVHTLAWRERGWGIAIKVEDGATRAQYPAVLALLQQLGALPTVLPDALLPFAGPPVANTRDEQVGEIRVAAEVLS
jgi:L-asparaginase II